MRWIRAVGIVTIVIAWVAGVAGIGGAWTGSVPSWRLLLAALFVVISTSLALGINSFLEEPTHKGCGPGTSEYSCPKWMIPDGHGGCTEMPFTPVGDESCLENYAGEYALSEEDRQRIMRRWH